MPPISICPQCGNQIRSGAHFCARCGAPANGRVCPTCNLVNVSSDHSCKRCGKALVRICTQCHEINKPQAKFCIRCSAALNSRCPHCGVGNRPGARFCANCGNDPSYQSPQVSLSGLIQNRYGVVKLIAQGGMGMVYQVEDGQRVGELFAMKEMLTDKIAPNELNETIQQFRQEARLLQQLDHLNLIKVFDSFSAASKEYLVMEYVKGKTLEEILSNGALQEKATLQIALQLCNALEYLHKQNPPIIYRDLKPANVMIEDDSNLLKLIDFGIARTYKPGGRSDTISIGTPGFASPEHYGKKGQTDARSDVFTLGVTIHVLLTNDTVDQHPWSYPPVSTLNPNASKTIENVILKATQLEVAKRYQSIDEMRKALLLCKNAKKIAQNLPVARPAKVAAPKPTPLAAPAVLANPPINPAPINRGGGVNAPAPAVPQFVPNPPLNPAVVVSEQQLSFVTTANRPANGQLTIASATATPIDIEVIPSADWIEVSSRTFREVSKTLDLTIAAGAIELPRQYRPTPNLLAPAWGWAVSKGAYRDPWNHPGSWPASLLLGIPTVVLGALAFALLWLVYQHTYFFVPGSVTRQETLAIKHAGGVEKILLTIAVAPAQARTIAGWSGAALAVSAELSLLAYFVSTLL